MLIIPSYSAHSYDYNDRVERDIARIITEMTGLECSDFGTTGTPRPEYDFKVGGVQVEVKTSIKPYIPVEVYKDDAQTIPAGLLSSTAPLVITLTLGTRPGFGDVGKLRVLKRKTLISEAVRHGSRYFYEGATPSQGSVTYSLPEHKVKHQIRDVWLGDVPLREINPGERAYDTDLIFKSNFGGLELQEWIETILEREASQ